MAPLRTSGNRRKNSDADQPWSYDFGGEWRATTVDPISLHMCQQYFDQFDPSVADALIAATNSDSAWYAVPSSDTFMLWAPEQGFAARIYVGDEYAAEVPFSDAV